MEASTESIGSEPTQNRPLPLSQHVGEATDRTSVEPGTNPTEDVLAQSNHSTGNADDGNDNNIIISSSSPSPSPSPSSEDTRTPVQTNTTTPEEKKPPHQLQRTTSAPSSLETAGSTLITQEAHHEKGKTLNTVTEGKSLTHATYHQDSDSPNRTIKLPPATPATVSKVHEELSNEAFEEFINSPRGQNVIVERSPGGRYVRFLEKLGSGASKDVYRAYDTTEGIEVAWNVVQLSGVPKTERNRIVNEVRLLERLHHSNIISFHGSWVNRERQEVNFVTEILSSGTLTSFIEKVQVIRWKIAKRWAFQILKGLEYLHLQDPPVIHRDLKCDNIFINGTSGDLRIGDLGLSTVHRNGKVLSVLGTPEFMAPDLYEESAYDEKVDIYAFGMCLLEILTKEVPYRECNNPAQIYKKVMSGERPECLSRLRSKMARDFVNLCLGYRDEATGKYIRPSCTELLTNPFLAKSVDDDSEVIVDLPLHRRTIIEDPIHQSYGTGTSDDTSNEEKVPLPISRRRTDSSVEDESDRFDEMPDSETNIRRVKVLMGRNEELKEDETPPPPPPPPTQPILNDGNSVMQGQGRQNSSDNLQLLQQSGSSFSAGDPGSGNGTPTPSPQLSQHVSRQQQGQQQPNSQQSQQNQPFLFAAAVIEDESASMPHYQDDMLKLIITLPVDGQTQNVQFGFHLVADDPVEVAREMVNELGIPREAVLEIGGTISALARQARMKQGNFRRHQQQMQAQAQAAAHSNASQTGAPNVNFDQAQAPQQLYQPQNTNQAGQPLPAGQGQTNASGAPAAAAQQAVQRPPQANPPANQQPASQTSADQGRAQPQAAQPSSNVSPVPPQVSRKQAVHPASGVSPVPPKVAKKQANQPASNVSPAPQQLQRKTSDQASLSQAVAEVPLQDSSQQAVENPGARAGDVVQELSGPEADEDDEDEDSVNEELRQLDEDYQKTMMRAQKVFDSRMDNLQRSKLEKEEQHKKTLEKHEKERIEFEKRVQQEAKEQSQRLEKMQREWESQRQLLGKTGKVRKKSNSNISGLHQSGELRSRSNSPIQDGEIRNFPAAVPQPQDQQQHLRSTSNESADS
jgi:WNK lysine deficient protein kinase